jgi:hypothetical protein
MSGVAMQISSDELLDIFDRHIAPHSMIGIDVAARLIAEWENEVVRQQRVAANVAATASTPVAPDQAVGLDQLRRMLTGGEER